VGFKNDGKQGFINKANPEDHQHHNIGNGRSHQPFPVSGMCKQITVCNHRHGDTNYNDPLGLYTSLKARNKKEDQDPIGKVQHSPGKGVARPGPEQRLIDPWKGEAEEGHRVQQVAKGIFIKIICPVGPFKQMVP